MRERAVMSPERIVADRRPCEKDGDCPPCGTGDKLMVVQTESRVTVGAKGDGASTILTVILIWRSVPRRKSSVRNDTKLRGLIGGRAAPTSRRAERPLRLREER